MAPTGFKVWSLVWGLLANQVALAVGYNMLSGRLFGPLSIFQDLEKCFLSEVLSVVAEFYGTYIPVQTCLSEADSLKARILYIFHGDHIGLHSSGEAKPDH